MIKKKNTHTHSANVAINQITEFGAKSRRSTEPANCFMALHDCITVKQVEQDLVVERGRERDKKNQNMHQIEDK